MHVILSTNLIMICNSTCKKTATLSETKALGCRWFAPQGASRLVLETSERTCSNVQMSVTVLPWLLILELVLCAGGFVCGIITAASLTITQGQFAGQCVLYGTILYNTTGGTLVLQSPSHPSLCYFISAISVCVSIYCFSITLYWTYTSCVDEEVNRGRLWLNVTLCVCGVLLFFLGVSGCTLRIGRERLCLSALHNVPFLHSCEEAENATWANPNTGTQFYSSLCSSERSAWVNFFFWILIVVVVLVQRRQETQSEFLWRVSEREPFFHRPV